MTTWIVARVETGGNSLPLLSKLGLMEDQIKLLNDLAKELKSAKRTREQSLATLMGAGIVDKNGKLTPLYSDEPAKKRKRK